METKYKFGNTVFNIVSDTELLKDERFETFRTDEDWDYMYRIVPKEDRQTIDIKRNNKSIELGLSKELIPKISISNLFSAAETAKLLPEKEQFVIHASYIVRDNKAILFTAPSGIGKSTQAKFWNKKHGCKIVNEDRAIISKEDGTYFAHGCWAMGKAGVSHNVTLPIKAIVLLEQGNCNEIKKMNVVEKFYHLVTQCTFDEAAHGQWITEALLELMDKLPVISYQCVNHISSVDELEKIL